MKLIIQFIYSLLEIYIVGELKNPLLYKNIIMPIIGPIPNTKSINFAEFFVCPNFWSFKFELVWFFFDFFFFMNDILLQLDFKGFYYVVGFEKFFNLKRLIWESKKNVMYNVMSMK